MTVLFLHFRQLISVSILSISIMALSSLSPEVSKGSATCTNCSIQNHANQENSCNQSNNYLNETINKLKSSTQWTAASDSSQKGIPLLMSLLINTNAPTLDSSSNPAPPAPPTSSPIKNILNPICSENALKSINLNKKQFASCNGNSISKVVGPCATGDYKNLIRNSFNVTADCLGDYLADNNEKEAKVYQLTALLGLFTQESGMNLNAYSPTKAIGSGQFTKAAVQDVNRIQFDKIKRHLSSSRNPLCNQIGTSLKDMKPTEANKCDQIEITKGNPLLNMIYTVGYLKLHQERFEKNFINSNNKIKDKILLNDYLPRLNKEEVNKLKAWIAVWAHNTGYAGIRTPFKNFLNQVKNQKPSLDTADKVLTAFTIYYNSYSARQEHKQYYAKIQKKLTKISDKTKLGDASCISIQ